MICHDNKVGNSKFNSFLAAPFRADVKSLLSLLNSFVWDVNDGSLVGNGLSQDQQLLNHIPSFLNNVWQNIAPSKV